MTKTIYLLRHAQTRCNVHSEIIGGRSSSVPLTETGTALARQAGDALRALDPYFDAIFCSTALRARETFQCLGLRHGEHYGSVSFSEQLEELDQGEWTGLVRAEVYTPEMVRRLERENPFFTPPGGESQHDVEVRMTEFIRKEILTRPGDGTFLIVGHGNAFRCLLRGILDSDASVTYKIGIDNLSTIRLRHDTERGWSIDWINRSVTDGFFSGMVKNTGETGQCVR